MSKRFSVKWREAEVEFQVAKLKALREEERKRERLAIFQQKQEAACKGLEEQETACKKADREMDVAAAKF